MSQSLPSSLEICVSTSIASSFFNIINKCVVNANGLIVRRTESFPGFSEASLFAARVK